MTVVLFILAALLWLFSDIVKWLLSLAALILLGFLLFDTDSTLAWLGNLFQ